MMRKNSNAKPVVHDIESKLYRRALLMLVVVILAIAAYVMFPGKGNSKNSAPAAAQSTSSRGEEITLNVIPLQKQDVNVKEQYIGYVTPIKSVDMVPKINGYLDEIWVKGGQEVKAGDNLVLIRQNEYKAQLDAAKAAVVQALADSDNARIYYDRIKKAGSKAVSPTDVDNAKAKFLSAQGALQQARANQALAQVNYEYTLLQAPISGQVGNVDLTKGNFVSPSSAPLFKIIQYDPIRVVFSITDKAYIDEMSRHPEDLFGGEKIKLKLANGTIFPQLGTFKYTGNEIDRTTNSIAIYADFPNPDKSLVANAYVDVILERLVKDAYLINQNYVTLAADGTFAYTIKDGKLLKTPLKIITAIGDQYVVGNQFSAKEYLVVDKVGRIPANARIRAKVNTPSAAVKETK